jgi:hypothetical protein
MNLDKIEITESGDSGLAVIMFEQVISSNSREVLLARKINELIDVIKTLNSKIDKKEVKQEATKDLAKPILKKYHYTPRPKREAKPKKPRIYDKEYQASYYKDKKEKIMLKRRLRKVDKDCEQCGKPLDPLRIHKTERFHRECVAPYQVENRIGMYA